MNEITKQLETPLFELGNLSLTPLLLLKIIAFLGGLFLLSAIVRRRIVLALLARAKVEEGIQYATARIVGYVIWVLGFMVGLPMLGIPLNSLMVALGAVGIGVGLGLQKIAENFISGLILLFGRPVKVGDRVKVGDVVGTVSEIQARVTLVTTNDNIVHLVPNAKLVSEEVVNLTHNDRVVRFHFPVGVSYGSDPNEVKECLLEVAKEHPKILSDPAPDVVFLGFGDSSLDFILRGFSRTMVQVPEVLTSEVNFRIWYALKERGITIPFPQRDLHIRSFDQAVPLDRAS